MKHIKSIEDVPINKGEKGRKNHNKKKINKKKGTETVTGKRVPLNR